jgi:hypothetical protein
LKADIFEGAVRRAIAQPLGKLSAVSLATREQERAEEETEQEVRAKSKH